MTLFFEKRLNRLGYEPVFNLALHVKKTFWIELLFEPRDLWVGCFWTFQKTTANKKTLIYFAIIPTLVLCVSFWNFGKRK